MRAQANDRLRGAPIDFRRTTIDDTNQPNVEIRHEMNFAQTNDGHNRLVRAAERAL